MAKYYKVPRKPIININHEFDDNDEVINTTEEIIGYEPDIPESVNFIGNMVGVNYFIKVADDAVIENGTVLNNIPDQLLNSKVKGVK